MESFSYDLNAALDLHTLGAQHDNWLQKLYELKHPKLCTLLVHFENQLTTSMEIPMSNGYNLEDIKKFLPLEVANDSHLDFSVRFGTKN